MVLVAENHCALSFALIDGMETSTIKIIFSHFIVWAYAMLRWLTCFNSMDKIGFHVDDSEVTLNVCLGKEFDGGELFFRGVRCDKHVNGEARPEVVLSTALRTISLNYYSLQASLKHALLWWESHQGNE